MNCKHCGASYKLTKFHKDPSVCLDCAGVTDDMSIEDDELKIDLWQLSNPSGKTKPVFEYDLETDI